MIAQAIQARLVIGQRIGDGRAPSRAVSRRTGEIADRNIALIRHRERTNREYLSRRWIRSVPDAALSLDGRSNSLLFK